MAAVTAGTVYDASSTTAAQRTNSGRSSRGASRPGRARGRRIESSAARRAAVSAAVRSVLLDVGAGRLAGGVGHGQLGVDHRPGVGEQQRADDEDQQAEGQHLDAADQPASPARGMRPDGREPMADRRRAAAPGGPAPAHRKRSTRHDERAVDRVEPDGAVHAGGQEPGAGTWSRSRTPSAVDPPPEVDPRPRWPSTAAACGLGVGLGLRRPRAGRRGRPVRPATPRAASSAGGRHHRGGVQVEEQLDREQQEARRTPGRRRTCRPGRCPAPLPWPSPSPAGAGPARSRQRPIWSTWLPVLSAVDWNIALKATHIARRGRP